MSENDTSAREIDRTGEQDQRLSAKVDGMTVEEFDSRIAEAGLR